jgi:hypothetical protein
MAFIYIPQALPGPVLKLHPENRHGPAGDAKMHDAGALNEH